MGSIRLPVAAATAAALAVMAPIGLVPYLAQRASAAVHMPEMLIEAVLTLPIFVASAAVGCTVAAHLVRGVTRSATNQRDGH